MGEFIVREPLEQLVEDSQKVRSLAYYLFNSWGVGRTRIMTKETDKQLTFLFIAVAACGKRLSGDNRIFIELARRWSKKQQRKVLR